MEFSCTKTTGRETGHWQLNLFTFVRLSALHTHTGPRHFLYTNKQDRNDNTIKITQKKSAIQNTLVALEVKLNYATLSLRLRDFPVDSRSRRGGE